MTDPFIKLQTHIRPPILKKNLIFGFGVGMLGVALLVLAYIYLPERQMRFLGPLIVIVWMFVEIASMRPYMILKELEKHPEDLILKDNVMIYRGRRILYENLKQIHFFDRGEHYGILLEFETGETRELPFFTKESFDVLKEHLKPPPPMPDIRSKMRIN